MKTKARITAGYIFDAAHGTDCRASPAPAGRELRNGAKPVEPLRAADYGLAPSRRLWHGLSRRKVLRCSSSVVEHSLGKGEVESSILSCSTINSQGKSKAKSLSVEERSFLDARSCRERTLNSASLLGQRWARGSQLVRHGSAASHRIPISVCTCQLRFPQLLPESAAARCAPHTSIPKCETPRSSEAARR